MLVVDASVLAPAIVDSGTDGDACRAAMRGNILAAPDLLRVEVLSVIRRLTANGTLTKRKAQNAIYDLIALPLQVFPTEPLLRRCWALHGNVTSYDACYVALAEALDCPLLTGDTKLANAPGPLCHFQLV